jgi:hypothetical protein
MRAPGDGFQLDLLLAADVAFADHDGPDPAEDEAEGHDGEHDYPPVVGCDPVGSAVS